MSSFWNTLPQPFVGSAPMDGVTDNAYREILSKYSSPDVIFTEFVNVEGLCHNADQLLRTLLFTKKQRPVVAQVYGKTPDSFRQAATLVCELGFDGIDINMGCPSKNVASGGSGAGLIKTPNLAMKIIQAVRQGVDDWANGASCKDCADFSDEFCQLVTKQSLLDSEVTERKKIPVSVKTRIGTSEPEIDGWISPLLETKPVALSIHGRTTKQAYKGQANWEVIEQISQLARANNSPTLIIGNGDIQSRSRGVELAKKYQLAGVLIGRAMQGNPYVFSGNQLQNSNFPKIALEHAQLFEKYFSHLPKYSFLPMRKHLAWYIKGVPEAKLVRQELVRANSSHEVEQIFTNFHLI